MNALLATAPKALWYLTRGTGGVSFVLLTAAVVLGIAHTIRWAPGHTPRFVMHDLHRNISLLVIVFIVIHVAAAVIDGFAPIRWLDMVVPFASAYRALWLGLGAVAFDLLLAVAITSLLRARMGFRVWKGIHWAAYACWAIAIFHGLGVGSDTRQTWMLALVTGSVVAVVAATWWRVAIGWSSWEPTRVALATGGAMVPATLAAFLVLGPLNPGWGHAPATAAPPSPSSPQPASATTRSVRLVLPGQASFVGSASIFPSADARQVSLSGDARTTGAVPLKIHFDVAGTQAGGTLSIESGTLSIVPPDGAATYHGAVTGISEAGGLQASLTDGHGDRISVSLDLVISGSGSLSGDLGIRGLTGANASSSGDNE